MGQTSRFPKRVATRSSYSDGLCCTSRRWACGDSRAVTPDFRSKISQESPVRTVPVCSPRLEALLGVKLVGEVDVCSTVQQRPKVYSRSPEMNTSRVCHPYCNDRFRTRHAGSPHVARRAQLDSLNRIYCKRIAGARSTCGQTDQLGGR